MERQRMRMKNRNVSLIFKLLSFTIVAFVIYGVIVSSVSMWVDDAHYDPIKLLNTGVGSFFITILIVGIMGIVVYDLIIKRKKGREMNKGKP